jgi:hypothetical protein
VAYFSIASVGNSEVRGWSSSRLAFEPRDWQVDLRAELRKRITALSPEPGWLVAELYTVDASHYDVENALLYNVGPSAFAGLTHRGLAFRGYAVHPSASPEALTPVESAHPVLVRYAVRHSPPSWFSGSAAGRLSFRLPKLSGASKPHDVWLAASSTADVSRSRFTCRLRAATSREASPTC